MADKIYLKIFSYKKGPNDNETFKINLKKYHEIMPGGYNASDFNSEEFYILKAYRNKNFEGYIDSISWLAKKIRSLIVENNIYINDENSTAPNGLIPNLAYDIAIDFFDNNCEDVEWNITNIDAPIKKCSLIQDEDSHKILYYDSLTNSYFRGKDIWETIERLEDEVFPGDDYTLSIKDYMDALQEYNKTIQNEIDEIKAIVHPKNSQPLDAHIAYLNSCVHFLDKNINLINERLNNLETEQKILKSAVASSIK